ncbi:MAG TPA: hypothetical protein VGR31_03805 [Planctomycetota bacterium]|nr:hypothetical protein [Planctomycetota bacterium]
MKPFAAFVFFVAVSGCAATADSGSARIDAKSAFEQLRGVEGDWRGEVIEGAWIREGDQEGVHQPGGVRPVEGRYHVTSGGSVVEATMFRGMSREMVMMFHFDDGKLMLTQYDEGGNSTSLVADSIEPAFPDDVVAPDTTREPDGIVIRFSPPRATNRARWDDEYLHDVIVLVLKDGTHTIWRFYRDGAPTRGVFVELTQKDAPRALADSRSKGN